MKRVLIPMTVALGAVLLAPAALGAEQAASDRAYPIAAEESVGPWTLIAANDQQGAFHHCELSREQGDYQLSFLRGTAGYVLVVVNPAWQLPDGATYTVGLQGNGLDRVNYEASSAGTGIIILLGEDPEIVSKLASVGTLELNAAQATIPLAMDQAREGLDSLEACWTGRTSAASNPFASPGAQATNPNPFAMADASGPSRPGATPQAVAGRSAPAAAGFAISVPRVTATGSNRTEAEIARIFEGDFERLAGLTADRVTVPEIVTSFPGGKAGGAKPIEIAYHDVVFSGLADGRAAKASVGSIELRSENLRMTFDDLSAGELNISGLLGFYGLAASGSPDTLRPLYGNFAIGGARIELAGASCRLGPVEAGEFSSRPMRFTPAESAELIQSLSGKRNEPPTSDAIGKLARLYADYLTAFQSGPLQITGLSCTARNASGKTVTVAADRLGMDGLQPHRFPGIEARNLKLDVEGEGSFAAKALILKPADASDLVAALLEAGDSPDPAWFAKNARRLVPAFEGLQLAGVAFNLPDTATPGERLRIGLKEADLSLDGYRGGIPTGVKLTAFGISVPMTGEEAKPLADMGYESLELGAILSARWDPDAGTIAIDQLALSGEKMGSAALAATLTNATADLFSGDGVRAMGAGLLLGVKSIDLTLNDAGLRDRLIAAGAESAGLDAKTFTAGLTALVGQYVPQGRAWSSELEKAATAFVKGAPSMTVRLTADAPVAAAQLIAAQSDPASLLDLFTVSASAKR